MQVIFFGGAISFFGGSYHESGKRREKLSPDRVDEPGTVGYLESEALLSWMV